MERRIHGFEEVSPDNARPESWATREFMTNRRRGTAILQANVPPWFSGLPPGRKCAFFFHDGLPFGPDTAY